MSDLNKKYPRVAPYFQTTTYAIVDFIATTINSAIPTLNVYRSKKNPFQIENLPAINVIAPSSQAQVAPDGGNYNRSRRVIIEIILSGQTPEETDGYDETIDAKADELENQILNLFLNDIETLGKRVHMFNFMGHNDVYESAEFHIIRRQLMFDAITKDGTRSKTALPPTP
jgi:hypothetical protein